MIQEVWKDVEGYEGFYWVSNLGRVKSQRKILKPQWEQSGYTHVVLSKEGSKSTKRIHRLVAIAFLQNHNNLAEVNHKDGDKQNNVVTNLEWVSRMENQLHCLQNLKSCYKGDIYVIDPQTGLVVEVLKGRANMIEKGYNPGKVYNVVNGKQKTHKGFSFRRNP